MTKHFLVTASLLAALFFVAEAAGFGAHTAVLSGMVTDAPSAFAGLVYVFAWFGAIVAAPIFAIAGIVHGCVARRY